jgi:hypothetical protein
MWADFLSMFAVGAFAACMVFIVRRSMNKRGRSMARWVMPAAIGASMITYSIWNEYTWTFLKPVTVRFIALDTNARVRSEQRPELIVTELLLVERWQPTRKVSVAFDCAQSKRADLGAGITMRPDGTLLGTHWQSMETNSPMLRAACRPHQPA